jgi:hypothetical protein
MKKLIYLLSISFLMLQACSSGDGTNSNTSSSQLVGKWEVFQVAIYPAGTVITGNEPLSNFNFACPTLKGYVQFGSEGIAKVASYNSNCSEQANIGTYTKTDFLINFYQNNDYSGSWEIISLNNTSLKVKYPNPSTGTPVEIFVMSFKKI